MPPELLQHTMLFEATLSLRSISDRASPPVVDYVHWVGLLQIAMSWVASGASGSSCSTISCHTHLLYYTVLSIAGEFLTVIPKRISSPSI